MTCRCQSVPPRKRDRKIFLLQIYDFSVSYPDQHNKCRKLIESIFVVSFSFVTILNNKYRGKLIRKWVSPDIRNRCGTWLWGKNNIFVLIIKVCVVYMGKKTAKILLNDCYCLLTRWLISGRFITLLRLVNVWSQILTHLNSSQTERWWRNTEEEVDRWCFNHKFFEINKIMKSLD